jgi:hypothetical protein
MPTEEKPWDAVFVPGAKVRIKSDSSCHPGDEGIVVRCFLVLQDYWAVHVQFGKNDFPYSFSPGEVEPI